MIRAVAEEHGVKFSAVETEFAIDNGAMIAWTGVLAYKHGVATPIDKSYVRTKWRLEEVEIPWMH
jgi:N6-L-threonylcarbamoyladenine synthase